MASSYLNRIVAFLDPFALAFLPRPGVTCDMRFPGHKMKHITATATATTPYVADGSRSGVVGLRREQTAIGRTSEGFDLLACTLPSRTVL